MPTLVHFELPADDIDRAKKFYTSLFGWKIEKWKGLANNMEYLTINTTDDKGNKGVGGGYDEKNASRTPSYKLRRC